MNIFLIGYRCTGKTSVGMAIAKNINWRFIDADEYLTSNSGKTVAEIVEEGGWDHFRELEKRCLKEICSGNQQVIATGGGVVLLPENITKMKESGVVMWFSAEAKTIYVRMHQDTKTSEQRPALTDSKNILKEIEETLSQRKSLYEKAMDHQISTEHKDIGQVCKEAVIYLKSKNIIKQKKS